jgi:hypothetical protein
MKPSVHLRYLRPALLCLIVTSFVVRLAFDASRLCAADTPPTPMPPGVVKPFGPPTILKGTAHQRGLAYGTQYRAEVNEFLKEQIYGRFVGRFSKEDLSRYANECGKVVREADPVIADEIAGIAEGAGIEFDEVILLELHEELYHRMELPVKDGHCTAVGVNPSESGDGHAYLGQTWDWMVSVAGKSFLTEWRRDGMSVLAYGYGGLPFGAGMNSEGIALCWTSAALRNTVQSPRVGMPSYTLIAHLLSQKDIDGVVREAQRVTNAGWFTFVVNDAEGNIVNIEGSPAGIEIERSGKFMVRADYGSKKKQAEAAQLIKDWRPAARCAVFEKLLAQTAGMNNKGQLQKYLQDPKYGIASGGPRKNVSIDVMLFDTTAKKAYFTRGPNYGIEWREFGFSENK